MPNVRWTRPALSDLNDIVRYMSRDDPSAVRRLASKLREVTPALKDQAQLGRMVPETGNESIRELVRGNYRVMYRVANSEVQILAVVEAHRLV
jgi:toxin ParE1/3/4